MTPAALPPNRRTWFRHGLSLALLGAALTLGGWSPLARAQRVALPVDEPEIVNRHPHDPTAFTQGLLFRDGQLFESTGLNGRSSIRRVRLEDGQVQQKRDIAQEHFAEGLTAWKDELYLLTWTTHKVFVFDLKTFEPKREYKLPGEGWGLTHDGQQLYLSDGSAELRVLDPKTFRELRRISVRALGQPVDQLNELEWVDGEIYANIWQADIIARIDPASGQVRGWIDLRSLRSQLPAPAQFGPRKPRPEEAPEVLNGIAWDATGKRLFVTGKLWPTLFEIRLKRRG
ncbi:glutaminyl-peptide cyclotransferase [Paucibacter sp. DJ2R-2]|uniref:glutaminyl-peptide cyclotransferase n=1 Tax=Paucibacter sp. DJ2R-2 TaxID=2893558 RepID=UPI0021E371B1|nr:glutaminyl-peptide cyclotransferase [Paucibacter sp. DJ2R-2]MCV2420813.1 glutaminyl-peptide cyclotransferase [Paucibacter sp. DJ4R-1]MCV2440012.1 glutaminyl-peptide cyclotransferase [Paucibacter sp. DJ2R-2]